MKSIVARRVEKSADKRPLLELINLWYHYHGQQLKIGVSEDKHLIMIDRDLGHPRADQISPIRCYLLLLIKQENPRQLG